VASAEADIEGRQRDLKQARNALALLLGTALPADLPEGMRLESQPVLTALPAGLPSDLLLRRPDILQAEQSLRAANADIGAARAAFFPRLALTATLGYASPALGSLFQGSQVAWGFTPQLIQPLFDNGRLESGLELARARRSTAVAEYEKSIQTAFREVADGLAANATLTRQIGAQQRVVASAERRRELSSLRYRAGQDSRLELLDAQRQAYAARQGLLSLQRLAFKSILSLYKALGGGLQETTAEPA
jgi:NodT family efflux transporter outer membrane factor (OMF) lipoprotein